jgi:hypothetical protein
MNTLKPSYLNSMTLKKIEDFDGKDFFYGFFYVCVLFHRKFIIKCNTLWSFCRKCKNVTRCDQTEGHSNSVNTMSFRVLFFCLILFNSRQLSTCLP